MIIKETIERQCCQKQDLIPVVQNIFKEHSNINYVKPEFCKHCGRLWGWTRTMGPAGSMENVFVPIKIEKWDYDD